MVGNLLKKRKISTSAALRTIARGEKVGSGAAWRAIYEQGLSDILTRFQGPRCRRRWTGQRLRMLEGYGVGGALARFLNSRADGTARDKILAALQGDMPPALGSVPTDERLRALFEHVEELSRQTRELIEHEPRQKNRQAYRWGRVLELIAMYFPIATQQAEAMKLEAQLFALHRFALHRCWSGAHWYFRSLRTQEVCPVHRATEYMRRHRRSPAISQRQQQRGERPLRRPRVKVVVTESLPSVVKEVWEKTRAEVEKRWIEWQRHNGRPGKVADGEGYVNWYRRARSALRLAVETRQSGPALQLAIDKWRAWWLKHDGLPIETEKKEHPWRRSYKEPVSRTGPHLGREIGHEESV